MYPFLYLKYLITIENSLFHYLKEKKMNTLVKKNRPKVNKIVAEEKKFLIFQFILLKQTMSTLEKKLEVQKTNLSKFIDKILSNKTPEVQLIDEIETTEQLLWLYKDAARMYSVIKNPSQCANGYYVCVLEGITTCCKNEILMRSFLKTDSTNHIEDISELLKDNAILYWNCNITIYHTINTDGECKKADVEEVLLRPKEGIKILDLHNIDNVNFNNIKTIHFGAPYDIFIDL